MPEQYASDEEYARALQQKEDKVVAWMEGSLGERTKAINPEVPTASGPKPFYIASNSTISAEEHHEEEKEAVSAPAIKAPKSSPIRTTYQYYKVLVRPLQLTHYHEAYDEMFIKHRHGAADNVIITNDYGTTYYEAQAENYTGRAKYIFEPEKVYAEARRRMNLFKTMDIVEDSGDKRGFLIKVPELAGMKHPFTSEHWQRKVDVQRFWPDGGADMVVVGDSEASSLDITRIRCPSLNE